MTVSPAATAAPTPTAAAASSGSNALTKLSGNLNDFLNLLMTQLKNQDPTAPMDTNTFTTQLVQFSSVEQQINTNANLNTLIQATQGNTLLNSASLVGKPVQVTSDQLTLQNGTAAIDFQASAAGPVDIGVYSAGGTKLAGGTVGAHAGANTWSWNGINQNGGNHMPDDAYKVIVTGADGTKIPFTVLGTATAVERSGTKINVQLGGLHVDFGAVQSVGN